MFVAGGDTPLLGRVSPGQGSCGGLGMRMVVRAAGLVALAGLTLAGLAACASDSPNAGVAERAQAQLVGLPKAQLLTCAGEPTRQAVVDGSEYYTYSKRPDYTSDGPNASLAVGAATGEGIGLALGIGVPAFSTQGVQGCDATFVLRGGVVRQVSYPMGANLEDCGPIVAACMAR